MNCLEFKIQIFPREINTSVPLEQSGVEYIFDVFKAQNYSTLMSDDGIEWPMFTYQKRSHGWHKQPFDFYDKFVLGSVHFDLGRRKQPHSCF